MAAKPDRMAWLKGGKAHCNEQPQPQFKPYRLVLIGPPGVGKGTQAALLTSALGACHLSTGDIFRAINTLPEAERTPTMNCALEQMRAGELVPYETVVSLVAERAGCLRCHGGFILDGFPRTFAQAVILDEMLAERSVRLDAVINYDLPLPQIVARISGRRVCSGCGAVFHLESRAPKKEGICDLCGKALFQRTDDRPESVRVRMQVHDKSTAVVLEHYRRKGLLQVIPAASTPEDTFNRTMVALGIDPKIAQRKNGQVAPVN